VSARPGAWRRLLADVPTGASLVLLALLGAVAALAPLLPLPSPIAIELAREPGPPNFSPLLDHGWQHRVSVHFAVPDATGTGDLGRAAGRLEALVAEAAAAPATAFTGASTIEVALFYAPELDPARGSTLEERVRTHLAGASDGPRLLLGAGRDLQVHLTGLSAVQGLWPLGPFDRALLGLRQRLFGFTQTTHWLGTDAKGRDLLARLVWGARVSLQVALAAALVSLVIGVLWGATAGWIGGRVDAVLMRIVDALYAIPFLFVVIFVLTTLGSRAGTGTAGAPPLTAFYAVLGAVTWLTMARVVRGEVLRLKNQEFVAASRVIGASGARILFTHLLPNCLGVIAVYLTLTIPSVMLLEAFLSFLGLGVQAPRVSWGVLASDAVESINPLRSTWWLALWPSLALAGTLLALNIVGDGLRDALDPRRSGRSGRRS
jgi:oligopeptide transport system permease protein